MVHLISRNMPGPKPTDELTDMAGVRQDRNLMEYLFAPSYCTQYTRKKCYDEYASNLEACYVEHNADRTISVGSDSCRIHITQLHLDLPRTDPFTYLIPGRPARDIYKGLFWKRGDLVYFDRADKGVEGWSMHKDSDPYRKKHKFFPAITRDYPDFPKAIPVNHGLHRIAEIELTNQLGDTVKAFDRMLASTYSEVGLGRCQIVTDYREGQFRLVFTSTDTSGATHADLSGPVAYSDMTMAIPSRINPHRDIHVYYSGRFLCEHIETMVNLHRDAIMTIYSGDDGLSTEVVTEEASHIYVQMPMVKPKHADMHPVF